MKSKFSFPKRLLRFANPIKDIESERDVYQYLIKHNWEKVGYNRCLSPCRKYFIKQGYFCFLALPRERIPTHFINKRPKKGSDYRCWVLQPVADVSNEAIKEADKYFSKDKYRRWDNHSGNVAIFRKQKVLIDW